MENKDITYVGKGISSYTIGNFFTLHPKMFAKTPLTRTKNMVVLMQKFNPFQLSVTQSHLSKITNGSFGRMRQKK